MTQRQSTIPRLMMSAAYTTQNGAAYCGDARDILGQIPSDSVDLIFTSPPFALLRQKEYGNKNQADYVEWLCGFGPEIRRVLRNTGSLVLDLGGAYKRGVPVRSLHQFRVLLKMCDEIGFFLAEEFFWHNPAKLPSPIEWVNKRKLRAKDSVNTLWWLSKTEWPKADIRNVLVPYSERMKTLLKDPEKFYKAKDRPSGHGISMGFSSANGGAIPPNLLQIPNTESNSLYLRLSQLVGIPGHPARFPVALPEFFIRFLTAPSDLVVDIFSGSNTTGQAAESLDRRWISVEIDKQYVAGSSLRFMGHLAPEKCRKAYAQVLDGNEAWPVDLGQPQTLFDSHDAVASEPVG